MQLEAGRRIGSESRKKSQRKRMRIQLCESVIGGRINQDGTVAGGKDFDIGRPGPAGGSDESHESPRCEISAKRLMDVFESRRKILRDAKVATRIRVADCCKQRRAYAVTSNIGKADDQLAVGHGLPIEVVAPGVVGGLVPARNVESV